MCTLIFIRQTFNWPIKELTKRLCGLLTTPYVHTEYTLCAKILKTIKKTHSKNSSLNTQSSKHKKIFMPKVEEDKMLMFILILQAKIGVSSVDERVRTFNFLFAINIFDLH